MTLDEAIEKVSNRIEFNKARGYDCVLIWHPEIPYEHKANIINHFTTMGITCLGGPNSVKFIWEV
jgi:hypothetical protein